MFVVVFVVVLTRKWTVRREGIAARDSVLVSSAATLEVFVSNFSSKSRVTEFKLSSVVAIATRVELSPGEMRWEKLTV